MARIRSVMLTVVGIALIAAGCGENQTTLSTTVRPPTTSTTETTVASTTTAVDPLREFRDAAAPSAREVNALGQEAVRINEEWDARTTDYVTTHARLEELVAEVEEFAVAAPDFQVPSAIAARWDMDEALEGLAESSREMLVGLEMSDDGSHRREALNTFTSLAASYVTATGVIIPPSTTTSIPATTTTTPATTTTVTPFPVTGDDRDGNGCHDSYTGKCVPPDVSDVDCAGGSGNGPYYVGRVTVVGYDEYGLDRDNDGVGCE